MDNMDRLRVLELYSGIGGMHYALKGTSFCLKLELLLKHMTDTGSVAKALSVSVKLLTRW